MSAMIPDTIRDLAAGYALGALTPDETRAFEAAMKAAPELAAEVAEYREVNALLAHAGATAPSPAVKARLADRIRREKVVPLRPGRSWLLPVMTVAAAASALLAVNLNQRLRTATEHLNSRDAKLAAVEAQLARKELTLNTLLTAESDLAVVQLTATGNQAPGIQFFWNRRSNMGVLHAFRLPPAPEGKVYQFWLLRDGTPYPSATFTSAADGHALVQAFELPGGGFQAAAVTIEPVGGSTKPTMPILLVGKV